MKFAYDKEELSKNTVSFISLRNFRQNPQKDGFYSGRLFTLRSQGRRRKI